MEWLYKQWRDSAARTAADRSIFAVVSICAVGLIFALALDDWKLAASDRWNASSRSEAGRIGGARRLEPASTSGAQPNFVATLPPTPNLDAIIRFTSRLARDQGVRVSQVQSETTASGASQLSQAKCTLQLRGDYRGIKNVTIGLLAKFPGLILQRLVIHHRDATSGSTADQSADEASLEFVQFLRPAATS